MLWENVFQTAGVIFVVCIMGIRVIDRKHELLLAGLATVLLMAFGVTFVSLIGIIWRS